MTQHYLLSSYYKFQRLRLLLKIFSQMHFRLHLQDLHNYNEESIHHPQIGLRLLYFIVPYAILIAISFTFYRRSVDSQSSFAADSYPSHSHQAILYYAVIISLGLCGLFAAVEDYWTTQAWILYLFSPIFLSIYVVLYQMTSTITLFVAMIISIALAFNLEWLFIETGHMGDEALGLIIRNLIGVAGAWALIFCILTVGLFFVHTIGSNKKAQSVCFFISAIALLTVVAIWNMDHYCKWSQAIGFIAMGATTMSLCVLNK